MPTLIRRLPAGAWPALVCVIGALAIGGCGGSDPQAPLAAAVRNASRAQGFRMNGTLQSSRYGLIRFDVDVVQGRGLQGLYIISGFHIKLIDLDGSVYLRYHAGAGARVLGERTSSAVTTRWIEDNSPSVTSDLAGALSIFQAFRTTDPSEFKATGSTTVAGTAGLTFRDPLNDERMTVAKSGRSYPLALELPSRKLTASFTRWNEHVVLSVPPHVESQAQLNRKPKVRVGTIANATVIPSTPQNGVRTFRAVGYAVKFDYPAELAVARLGPERLAGHARSASHIALAISDYSMLAVSRYQGLPVPVSSANIHILSPSFVRTVSALAGHNVSVRFSTIHGIPVMRFAPYKTTLQGTPLTEQIVNAFVGDDEYELRCQFSGSTDAPIEQACRKMISTLTKTTPPR